MTTADPHIRLARPGDRDAILDFVQRMGFNPRDAVTWDGLRMAAVTAWRGEALIGAIPLEPRILQVSPGRSLPIVHETVVAIAPEFRGQGIGSRMQRAIVESRPGGAELVSVFREEPQSPAYRWYVKNGFSPAMRIDSWFCDRIQASGATPEVIDPASAEVDWDRLEAIWQEEASRRCGGFVDRRTRRLKEWLAVHPYRRRYEFRLVIERRGGDIGGYALLGIGAMHSQTTRIDILELASGEESSPDALLRQIIGLADARGYRPIRWPLASGDPARESARRMGFAPQWSFDMLIRPLSAAGEAAMAQARDWRYAGIDYI